MGDVVGLYGTGHLGEATLPPDFSNGNFIDPASERLLKERLEREVDIAEKHRQRLHELMLQTLGDVPTFALDLVEKYADAKARELLSRRALEGCGW